VKVLKNILLCALCVLCGSSARAAEEEDYYKLITIPVPEGVVLEVGGLAALPNHRLVATTRRGEVWIIDGAYEDPPVNVKFKRFAYGLHEPLGVKYRDGAFYVMQRTELTRLRDLDGDDVADEYTTLATGWGVTGAYHEYAYGPVFDRDGNMIVTLNCTMGDKLNKNDTWRGWSLRIKPDGTWEPWSAGMRSPSGLGTNSAGDVFYTDQQGTWMGTCPLTQIERGDFHGYAEKQVTRTFELPQSPIKPMKIVEKVPIPVAAKEVPHLKLPAVWLPYRKMGQSATDVLCDTTAGKFGPFADQMFIGEFTLSMVLRVFLEKVDGKYQGAVFRFREGFQCGPFRETFGEDGSMFVGQTNRGWNSLGTKSYGLQRMVWTGKTPFEIQKMEAASDGFVLTFTQDVDPATAGDAKSYTMSSYTYEYHATYGSEEIDPRKLTIASAKVLDARRVKLTVDGLRPMYVHELEAAGVKSTGGETLLHDVGCYTLNRIPAAR